MPWRWRSPPQGRHLQAEAALRAGKHVLLEKPPGSDGQRAQSPDRRGAAAGRTLFASWHSRFAPAVEPARRFLAGRNIKSVVVEWKEDVKIWHPGQAWIGSPVGSGCLIPASMRSRSLPASAAAIFLTRAELLFPRRRAAPIAAELAFSDDTGSPIRAEFDWRQTGPQSWDIRVETDAGSLLLSGGGSRLVCDDRILVDEKPAEYRGVDRRFVELIAHGEVPMSTCRRWSMLPTPSCSAGAATSNRSSRIERGATGQIAGAVHLKCFRSLESPSHLRGLMVRDARRRAPHHEGLRSSRIASRSDASRRMKP